MWQSERKLLNIYHCQGWTEKPQALAGIMVLYRAAQLIKFLIAITIMDATIT